MRRPAVVPRVCRVVSRDNHFVRCSCTAQSVIRQAADTFVAGRFGDSEIWRGFSWSLEAEWENGCLKFLSRT